MPLHPNAIAEHRAATERAGGIDRYDANRSAQTPQLGDQAVDERTLARAGRTCDAYLVRASRMLKNTPDELRAFRPLVFDETDCACDGPWIAVEHTLEQRRSCGGGCAFGHWPSNWRAMTSR
jgi:hypothetical protein